MGHRWQRIVAGPCGRENSDLEQTNLPLSQVLSRRNILPRRRSCPGARGLEEAAWLGKAHPGAGVHRGPRSR
jgi:hypothetical protein